MEKQTPTVGGKPLLLPGEKATEEEWNLQNSLLLEAMNILKNNYPTNEAPEILKTIPIPAFRRKDQRVEDSDDKVTRDLAYAMMQGLGEDAQEIVANYVVEHEGDIFPNRTDKNEYGTPDLDKAAYDGCIRTGLRVRKAIITSLTTKLTPQQQSEQAVKYEMNKRFFEAMYERVAGGRGPKQSYRAQYGSTFKQVFKVEKGRIVVDQVWIKQYGLKDPLTWSEFTFFAWKRYVEELNKAGKQTGSTGTGVLDTLRDVKVEAIKNERTVAVIRALHRLAGKDLEKGRNTWVEKDHEQYFLALLGTPNALGSGWLLADHNNELGGYTIESIVTEKLPDGGPWYMYINFKKVGLP